MTGRDRAEGETMNVPDEWVETAAKAYIMATTNGCCDQWPRPCADCDCFRDECPDMRAGYDREAARAALEAVWPLVEARVAAARAEALEGPWRVNRLEVINHLPDGEGRALVTIADKLGVSEFDVEFAMQDDGRTLKVFVAALRDGGGQ